MTGRVPTCERCERKGHTAADCGTTLVIPNPPDQGRGTPEETHPVAPDEKGCYGWPRACDHYDDLDCMTAEQEADRG